MSGAIDTPRQTGDESPDESWTSSNDLESLIEACEDVDEFRTLLQNRGIWLNRRAAESAFYSLRADEGEELDDDSLGCVTGGVRSAFETSTLLQELLHNL